MKGYLSIPMCFLILALFAAPSEALDKVNLVGTWVGEATLEGQPPNELTLVMVEKDGELSGTITGQYGTLVDTPLENIKVENGTFTFEIMIPTGGGDIQAVFKMTVEGDTMKGEFELPEMGASGTWEAVRQKE